MRKILLTVLAVLTLVSFSGCKKQEKTIDIIQMKAISEMASVECYMHIVANSETDSDNAWYEFWKKEGCRFWVEYGGIVTVGVDSSKIEMSIVDNVVTITLPKAEVMEVSIDDDAGFIFYYDPETYKPDGNEEKNAVNKALDGLREKVNNNQDLLDMATDNLKELLTNYINKISDINGVEYQINFVEAKSSEDV